MAHRDSFSHYGQDANSSLGSFPPVNIGIPAPALNNDLTPELPVQEKTTMPITNVTKIMRQILPPKTKISDDTKDMVQQCASKYISYITKKANERCHSEYRKIMKAEDLFWAMENLGFADYIAPLKLYLRRYRHEGNKSRGELVPPHGLVQNTNNNWFELGSGSGSGSGFGSGFGFGLEAVPVQSIVEVSQPTLPTVEIPQPNLPTTPAPIGPDFSIDPSPMDMFDLDEFRDGFGHPDGINFDDLFNGGDDGKTN